MSHPEPPILRWLSSGIRVGTASRYLLSLGVVAAATLCGLLVRPFLDPKNIAMVYLLAVVLSATTWGLGPSIFS